MTIRLDKGKKVELGDTWNVLTTKTTDILQMLIRSEIILEKKIIDAPYSNLLQGRRGAADLGTIDSGWLNQYSEDVAEDPPTENLPEKPPENPPAILKQLISPDRPVADAIMVRPDTRFVNPQDVVTLEGLLSRDSIGGKSLRYSWTQVLDPSAGKFVELSNPSSFQTNFVAPDVNTESDLTFELVVTDAFSQLGQPDLISDPDTVRVKVCPDKGNKDVATGIFYHIKPVAIDPTTASCDNSKIDVRIRPLKALRGTFPQHLYIVHTNAIGQETFYNGGPSVDPRNPVDTVSAGTGKYGPQGGGDWYPQASSGTSRSVTVLTGKDSIVA